MDFIKNNARAVVVLILVVLTVFAVGGNKKELNTETNQGQKAATENGDTNIAKDNVPVPTVNETPQKAGGVIKAGKDYSVTALKGDNQTKMVRRIMAEYFSTSETKLSAEQKLFIETTLVDSLPRNDLIFVGDTVKVTESEMLSTVEESQKLTKGQISAWSQYL